MALTTNNKKILYIGPGNFNPNSWNTRSDYILPDLFSSFDQETNIYWLTTTVPDFARNSLKKLCARYKIEHIEVDIIKNCYENLFEQWKDICAKTALKINPDVITNSLGSLRMGPAITHGANIIGCRSVIRVAGDEIGARVAMGKYKNNKKRYKKDINYEREGYAKADAIIAMSPWEQKRICNIIGKNHEKVKICIRGIDLTHFSPNADYYKKSKHTRLLYVGRKSKEKGYDVVEKASKLIYKYNKNIEFIFVGNFQPKKIDNCRYIGWVESSKLPVLYKGVDGFILVSRTEGFPQVVAEAMASGLPCILPNAIFSNFFFHEKDALFCDVTAESLSDQIIRLTEDKNLANRLSLRSRYNAENIFDKNLWKNRYRSIVIGNDDNTKKFTGFKDIIYDDDIRESKNNIRVAFITPRIFGIMGTQGSYRMAESFSKHVKTIIISKINHKKSNLPVVINNLELKNHYQIDFSTKTAILEIAFLLKNFNPHIIHFVNDHSWVTIIPYLKERFPSAKFILDIKTPLMAEDKKREALQTKGNIQVRHLDMIVSLSDEIAKTWISNINIKLLLYPLGIKLSKIEQRNYNQINVNKKLRFIYIGQTHPKRKLPKLIELVSCLEDEIKNKFTLDIIGAGGNADELDSIIEQMGLNDIVRRKEPLSQDKLYKLLPEYDCGIAWVPRELYDAAPSLKFLEYAASKIGIIASDTIAHKRNLDNGFHAILFTENRASFMNAVKKVFSGYMTQSLLEKNFEMAKQSDFDFIVNNLFLPEYKNLIHLNDVRNNKARLKLLFISPRPFGLIATPGTYLSIEAYSEHCDIHVIAKPRTSEDEIIVHFTEKKLQMTLIDPRDQFYSSKVIKVIKRIKPDIICIGQWLKWNKLVSSIRDVFPDIFISLEIKSPAVIKNKDKLKRVRNKWQSKHHDVDAIIAPAKGMVNTFIKKLESPFLQHNSIIDYNAIMKKNYQNGRKICQTFIFAGSISQHRRLDKFFILFKKLPKHILDTIKIDFYGDGPYRNELVQLRDNLNLNETIHFFGTLPQKELYKKYKEYDAGIAWVPINIYDSAPSLKLIEYCASGIVPIATSSNGHLMLKERGFYIKYFDEHNEKSFIDTFIEICTKGVNTEELRINMKLAINYDYNFVIEQQILPFYFQELNNKLNRKKYDNTIDSVNNKIKNNSDNFLYRWIKNAIFIFVNKLIYKIKKRILE